MNIHYVFDIDGTLTPARKPMDSDFAKKFHEWGQSNEFSLISGSDWDKIVEQVPNEILREASNIFACSGNHRLQPVGESEYEEDVGVFTSSQALEDYLTFELKWCNWSGIKYGKCFEFRPGLLNFSIIGRDCPFEMREEYYQWDRKDGERMRIVNYINTKFDSYEASIGGKISIDIVEKGKNKSQILSHFDLTTTLIEFYGDRIEDGNDRPLALKIEELGCGFSHQVSGYEEVGNLLFKESV